MTSRIIDLIEVEKGVYEVPKEKEYHIGFDFAAKDAKDNYIESIVFVDNSGKITFQKFTND